METVVIILLCQIFSKVNIHRIVSNELDYNRMKFILFGKTLGNVKLRSGALREVSRDGRTEINSCQCVFLHWCIELTCQKSCVLLVTVLQINAEHLVISYKPLYEQGPCLIAVFRNLML